MTRVCMVLMSFMGLPRWRSGKESTCQCMRCNRRGFDPWFRKILWRRKWQPPPVFLPGKFHGQRSLVTYSPWDHKELDMIEHERMHTRVHTHTHTHTQNVIYSKRMHHECLNVTSKLTLDITLDLGSQVIRAILTHFTIYVN